MTRAALYLSRVISLPVYLSGSLESEVPDNNIFRGFKSVDNGKYMETNNLSVLVIIHLSLNIVVVKTMLTLDGKQWLIWSKCREILHVAWWCIAKVFQWVAAMSAVAKTSVVQRTGHSGQHLSAYGLPNAPTDQEPYYK